MVGNTAGGFRMMLGIGQIRDRVAYGPPGASCRSLPERAGTMTEGLRPGSICLRDLVSVPVRTITLLVPEQRVGAVRFDGKIPLDIEIVPKTHEQYAFAPLRDSIVRGVEDARHHAIVEAALACLNMVPFEPRQMVTPILALFGD